MQEGTFNILCCDLPSHVSVNGADYKVKTSFRDWINFFVLHENEYLSSEEKIISSFSLYEDICLCDVQSKYEALQRFAACEGIPKNAKTNGGTGVSTAPVFSYLYDSVYIYADFQRYYNINLITADLHWYEFSALLSALPEKSETKQRIAYRSVNLAEIKSHERRKQIQKIQDSIRIPHNDITSEEIGQIFW